MATGNMKTISIQTKQTACQIGIHSPGYVLHLYYGEKTEGDMSYLLQGYDRGFSGNPWDAGENRTLSMDVFPLVPNHQTGRQV